MDVQKKLDEIVRAIGGARSMPMSASCVVNRAELLAMLEEVRAALPGSLAQAREVIGDREQLVAEAHQEARRIIDGAHAERGTLVSSSQVARQSQDAADRILAEARREAEEIRAEADDYVDSKLANFEVVLTKTIGSVDRGREKLLGRGPGAGPDGRADADAPEYSSDPQTLIQRGDAYVDAKLGAFEAVLSKTLEAVGRGRLKLQGHTPDALGEHLAAQDAAGASGAARLHTSDAEYLAGLAELADPEPGRPEPGRRADRALADRADRSAPGARDAAPVPPQPVYDPGYGVAPAAAAQQPYGQQPGYGHPEPVAQGFAPGYEQQSWPGYPQDPYAGYPQQGYEQPHEQGHEQPHAPGPHAGGASGYPYPDASGAQLPSQPDRQHQRQQGPALDETSFFDTGMIDLDQLRRYEQGR